ncbi:MarR family transcriptional regulator [Pacificimonas sp. ICDLI1SI03]
MTDYRTNRAASVTSGLASWMQTLIGYVRSAKPDLTNRQMAILLLVYLERGPHTVRGLAARLSVSKPVITRALNTLGAYGYIRRQKDESDLRNIFVERTASGEDFLESFEDLIAREDENDRDSDSRYSRDQPATH